MAKRSSLNGYFGDNPGAVRQSVPAIAQIFGLTIQNRKLQRVYYRGLRGNHVPFQYIEQIPPRAKTANYDDVEIHSRFESIPIYKSSGNNEFQLQLKYYAEGSEKLGHQTFWTVEQIERIVKKLEALTFPAYDDKFSPPDKVLLNIGSIYIDVPVVIKSVSLNYKPPYDIDTLQSRFIEATVDCKTAYPTYQAIGSSQIYLVATDRVAEDNGNSVYAFKKFSVLNNQ